MIAELDLSREMFQLLNKTAAVALIANLASRATSVALSQRVSPAPVVGNTREGNRGGRSRSRNIGRTSRAGRVSQASSYTGSRTPSRSGVSTTTTILAIPTILVTLYNNDSDDDTGSPKLNV